MRSRDREDYRESLDQSPSAAPSRWDQETRQEYEQWDRQLQDNIYTWGGFVDCFGCGEYHDPYELNELGLCKRCVRSV